jgi:hypothetical protein
MRTDFQKINFSSFRVLITIALLLTIPSGIPVLAGTLVLSGTNSTIVLSDTNGSILSVEAGGGTIATGGEAGLWSASFEDGTRIDATAFDAGSPTSIFQWQQPPPGDTLVLTYSNAAIVTTVTLSEREDGVEMSAHVKPASMTVLEFSLPERLRFTPTDTQRLIAPSHSSDGVGAAFNDIFFEPQPESSPAGWATEVEGTGGYLSLYGGGLVFRPVDDPPVPVSFTSDGLAWLGSALSNQWQSASAIVNRPPGTGQADIVLLSSTNGAFFSGSHLGGAGWLLRLGGRVDEASAPLALDAVIAAIEHLAQAPGGRTKVALLDMKRGPASGGWADVPVSDWRERLQNSGALASAGIEVVELTDAQAMLDALAGTDYLAVLNPYGEWTPVLTAGGMPATVTAIGDYVFAGGNWLEVGGHPFYSALVPTAYYSQDIDYPPAFADFLHLETTEGNASLYGVQPAPADPWAGETNAAALFVPGRLAWGGDGQGGYFERAFGIYIAPGQTWQSPVIRLALGRSVTSSLQAYGEANEFDRTLPEKMEPDLLSKFKESVLVNLDGTATEMTDHLYQLPSPAVVHFEQYLRGGFDKEYPDHFPPNVWFGTPAEFTNFLGQCRQAGLLSMPYSNPTWWCDNPRGPTFLAAGTDPLLIRLDGSYSYENYSGNDGYTVCHWHPDVQAANRAIRDEFLTTYPVDILFEDQVGARGWQYDLNTASPTPYAYAAGMAAQAAENSQSLPLSTENGWDRVINYEAQFSGMTWGLVPTENPPLWREFLRDRFDPATWEVFPLAQYLAHDKLSMIHHDLGQFVTNDEVLAWTLGLGYGMSLRFNAADLDRDSTAQWLLWLDRIQKSVSARYTGEPLHSFSHVWGTNPVDPDNGVMQATYGPVNILANLGSQPLVTNDFTLAPYGFLVSAPDMEAAHMLPQEGSSLNPIAYVMETGAGRIDFWIHAVGEQEVTIPLSAVPPDPAAVQLTSGETGEVQDGALTVMLGLKPGQQRIQPPSELAGIPPSQWPGGKPAIGILNLSGMPSAWATVSAAQWVQAFNQSSLATQLGAPIQQITSLSALTNALQAGPTAYLAIINPYGEVFPVSGAGQWPSMVGLIRDYVNNGGSWWETAGYSFYTAAWLSGGWQTETIGPSGMDSFGLPVGSGDVGQAPELLTVTADGQTIFGPALSAQLAAESTAVNRGLPGTEDDPGHLALLAGAEQDFLGAYRLEGWGYLWRYGGFNPNSNVLLATAPAVMTYLYTNAPLPAAASSQKYLWQGSIFSQSTLQTSHTEEGILVQIDNCPADAANHLERTLSLSDAAFWQPVFTFVSPPAQTNWTDSTPGLSQAFYRVWSELE